MSYFSFFNCFVEFGELDFCLTTSSLYKKEILAHFLVLVTSKITPVVFFFLHLQQFLGLMFVVAILTRKASG